MKIYSFSGKPAIISTALHQKCCSLNAAHYTYQTSGLFFKTYRQKSSQSANFFKALLAYDLNAKLLRLFQLASGALTRQHIVGLLRH